MNTIIHPITNVKYSIYSTEGKALLKQYVRMYQSGGLPRPRNDSVADDDGSDDGSDDDTGGGR